MFFQFAKYFHLEDPRYLTHDQIVEFVNYIVKEKKASRSYQNQVINALKFYFEKVLERVGWARVVERLGPLRHVYVLIVAMMKPAQRGRARSRASASLTSEA